MKLKRLACEISRVKNLLSRYTQNRDQIKYAEKLTSANSHILGFLARQENNDVYQKTIEERFSITKSTASKILKLMEQNGLIERVAVDNDARLKKIILTEEGIKVHQMIKDNLEEVQEVALTGFSDDERNQLFDYLERIKSNLNK